MFFQPLYNPRALFSKVYEWLQKGWLLCRLPKHGIKCWFGLNLISDFLKHWKKHGKNKAPEVEKGTRKIKTFIHLIQYLYWIKNKLEVPTSRYPARAITILSVVSDETIYCLLPLCSWIFLVKQNSTSNKTPSFSKKMHFMKCSSLRDWKSGLRLKNTTFLL